MRITISADGPYRVDGAQGIEVVWGDGTPLALDADTIYLCRCGGSTNKPFCDGTHSVIGFQGAIAAVERSEE